MEISLVKGYYMSVPKHFIYTHINPHGTGTILISILPMRPKEAKGLTQDDRESKGKARTPIWVWLGLIIFHYTAFPRYWIHLEILGRKINLQTMTVLFLPFQTWQFVFLFLVLLRWLGLSVALIVVTHDMFLSASVLVMYCCVINIPKLSVSKQQTFIISHNFWRLEIQE